VPVQIPSNFGKIGHRTSTSIVQGKYVRRRKTFFSLLANASSARTPRDQLIDQLSVVWVRGAVVV
jgi:hypothetical protein